MISDKFGGVRVTLINYLFMVIFCGLLFITLPDGTPVQVISMRSTAYLWVYS